MSTSQSVFVRDSTVVPFVYSIYFFNVSHYYPCCRQPNPSNDAANLRNTLLLVTIKVRKFYIFYCNDLVNLKSLFLFSYKIILLYDKHHLNCIQRLFFPPMYMTYLYFYNHLNIFVCVWIWENYNHVVFFFRSCLTYVNCKIFFIILTKLWNRSPLILVTELLSYMGIFIHLTDVIDILINILSFYCFWDMVLLMFCVIFS